MLEQVALSCRGRGEMYLVCLRAIRRYVEDDLKDGLGKEPAWVLSAKPKDDPLEIILYLTRLVVYHTMMSVFDVCISS